MKPEGHTETAKLSTWKNFIEQGLSKVESELDRDSFSAAIGHRLSRKFPTVEQDVIAPCIAREAAIIAVVFIDRIALDKEWYNWQIKIVNESHAALQKANERMRAELEGIMGLIESGQLVRDISHDGEPDWAIKQLGLVRTLANAKAALAEAGGETGI